MIADDDAKRLKTSNAPRDRRHGEINPRGDISHGAPRVLAQELKDLVVGGSKVTGAAGSVIRQALNNLLDVSQHVNCSLLRVQEPSMRGYCLRAGQSACFRRSAPRDISDPSRTTGIRMVR